jgi:D-glycero-D-manno-heptose 1,7-bisphosphate phosphatase
MGFKALFLDRDGVINIEKKYLYKIEDFEFIEGIFNLCKYYQNLGFKIVVVTNQSGIARGYYSEDDFNVLSQWMIEQFKNQGITINSVYHCPHHPDITGECMCRKPNAGMLINAKRDLDLDLKNSIIIGDRERDIEAGLNAGLRDTFLFDVTSKVKKSKAKKIINRLEEIYVNTK